MTDTDKMSLAEAIVDASAFGEDNIEPFRLSLEERCDLIVDEIKEKLRKTLFDFTVDEGHSANQLDQAKKAHLVSRNSHRSMAHNWRHIPAKAAYGEDRVAGYARDEDKKADKHERAARVAERLKTKMANQGVAHTSKLRKEEEEINEVIRYSNSSGQGHDPDHADHIFHETILKHGYRYSHSTPIRNRDGGHTNHHTYKHVDNTDKNVSVHYGPSGFHVWSTSTSGSGHQPTRGISVDDLHKHLKTRKIKAKQTSSSPDDLKEGANINESNDYTQDKYGTWRDAEGNATAVFSRVSAKNGRVIGEYGPHISREHAANEAFAKHPKAKTVSTYHQHGRNIQWHNR